MGFETQDIERKVLSILKVLSDSTVCEIPVELNRIGMVLIGGLNPVAAVAEAGIATENHAMSAVVEYQKLIKFEEL